MFLRVPDSQQGDKGSDSTTEEQPQGIEMEGKSPRKDKKEKKEKKKEGKTPRSARGEKKDGAKTPRRKEEGSAILDMPNIEVSGPTNKVSVQLKDCPVQSVTVYNDRAEVTRTLVASIKAGTNEVSVSGLSSKVDSNSVRMSGGKGAAVILEVSYNSRWEPKIKDDGTEAGRLKKELEEIQDNIARHNESLARLLKESRWVEDWGRTLSEQHKESNETTFFSSQTMEQAVQFMDFYQRKLADIDDRRSEVEKTLKELRQQNDRVSKSLNAISGDATEQVHEVILLLTAPADTNVELSLSYVVLGASWHAAYDVRVQSNKDQLDLTYYGIIVNSSFDDWNDAPLSLSTAQPSVGGAPPELTTKFVGFRQPDHYYGHGGAWSRSVNPTYLQAEVSNFSPFRAEEESCDKPSSTSFNDNPQLQVMTSAAQESSICTSFSIPRKTTILSDNKPHKVTIRMIQLKAKFTYVIIPKLSTHAYLKASIHNTTENYPLLPGEINVFMDGNFVAKSNIKAVSPNESFALFLGIDDAIKVTYPPGVFFNETQGLLRKSNLRTTTHTTTIKNTKPEDISVIVFDQVPKSNDSLIKVRVLKPVLQDGAGTDVVLTDANNLKWKKQIPAGKQLQIPFEYSVEWPTGQELTL